MIERATVVTTALYLCCIAACSSGSTPTGGSPGAADVCCQLSSPAVQTCACDTSPAACVSSTMNGVAFVAAVVDSCGGDAAVCCSITTCSSCDGGAHVVCSACAAEDGG